MRSIVGIQSEPRVEERKRRGSTGLKKPVLESHSKSIRSEKQNQKEKLIVLLILRALKEFYDETEGNDVCMHSPRSMETTMMNTTIGQKEESLDFEMFYMAIEQCLHQQDVMDEDSLFHYIKQLVYSFKKGQC